MLLRALLAGAAAVFFEAAAVGHPIESVIEELQKLTVQAEEQHKQEEVLYTTFEHWCHNSERSLNTAIAQGKASLDELSSTIESHTKNIEVLGKEIDALAEELTKLDGSRAAADSERSNGASLYATEKQSLEDTIKGISDAISLLSQTKGNVEPALLQRVRRGVAAVAALVAPVATPTQRAALQAFVAQDPVRPDLKAAGDQSAHVKKYDFKSDNVIELLKTLKLKFEDELVAANAAETNAINAHALATEAHNNLVKAKQDAKAGKEAEKTDSETELADAKSRAGDATADLEADSAALSSTTTACNTKKAEWAERSDIRQREKEALAAAISILSKVSGVRTEAPTNPVMPAAPAAATALLQLAATNPKAEKAVQLLRSQAQLSHSKALEKLAATLASHEQGPFDEVINMIQKMIFRLMNEQKEEDEHKQWCDLESSKTKASITDKNEKITFLTAKIDEATARSADLAEEIADANAMVTKITADEKEATEIRRIGREENAAAIKDATDAQRALANAVAVLKDFYKSSGGMKKEAWEFVQAPVQLPDTPSTWEASYTGVADPAAQPDGIVSILEKVSADFAQMESQTRAQESSDQESFQEQMKTWAIEKTRRSKEAEMKNQERQRLVEKTASLTAQRKNVAGELEATQQYLKDLSPACFDGTSTYDDRKEARAKEVEALKEAQQLLQDAFKEPAGTPPPAFLARRKTPAKPVLSAGVV